MQGVFDCKTQACSATMLWMASVLQIASPDAARRIQRVQTVTIAFGGWSRVLLLKILLAVFALASHAQSKPLQEPNQTSAVDQMFSQEFAKDRAGAVTVGLLKKGQLVWTKSYGVLDQRHKLPATESTVYGIASVTKMFAGHASPTCGDWKLVTSAKKVRDWIASQPEPTPEEDA
jgi:CubicO group peptidase (beta-lactamase class C family)